MKGLQKRKLNYYKSPDVCFHHSICREDSADQSQSANSQVQRERQVGAKDLLMLVLTISFKPKRSVNLNSTISAVFSDLEFDLNVNNTVGIRNTFLLRSYAYGGCK